MPSEDREPGVNPPEGRAVPNDPSPPAPTEQPGEGNVDYTAEDTASTDIEPSSEGSSHGTTAIAAPPADQPAEGDVDYPAEDTASTDVESSSEGGSHETAAIAAPPAAIVPAGGGAPPAKAGGGGDDEDDEDGDEEGMVRMSFLGHLQELRMRIIYALGGLGVSFLLCLIFANDLWRIISAPGLQSLKNVGAEPNLVFLKPVEAFSVLWVKAPMLAAIFLAAPWLVYQIWAFIAPGLYKRERRWAAPFVICTAGLFILGGLFAYFVAFRFGLEFLFGIGKDIGVKPVIQASEYFDFFVNVTLGIGLVFELPVMLFFLTLLRIVSPRFLLRNTRYAILLIVIMAAVVTPTPDIFNLMLFSLPMCMLFFVGVFASYVLVLQREKRRFPWAKILYGLFAVLVVIAAALWLAMTRYGYHWVPGWPFLTR